MSVKTCYICNQDPIVKRRYGRSGLTDGEICPICYQSVCRYHLTTIRWRWRSNGDVESDLVCKECKRSYAHRNWDSANREWIT